MTEHERRCTQVRGHERLSGDDNGTLPATISIADLARVIDRSVATARRTVKAGDIPTLRTGDRRKLIPTRLLRDLLGMTDDELRAKLADVEVSA